MISDWRTSGFNKHGKRGDSRQAKAARAFATPVSTSRQVTEWQRREAHLVKRLAKAKNQQRLLEQEVATLKKQLVDAQASASTSHPDQELCAHLHKAISERETARDQARIEKRRVDKCKAAYAALARKYNHLLEHHVKKSTPSKLDCYGTNLNDAEKYALHFEECDEKVQQDIAHASSSRLAQQLGILDSSSPADPLALFTD